MGEKSGRQLASGMKAISLSTLQRKTGWLQAVAPRLSLQTFVSQFFAVLQDNFPSEAAGVFGNHVPPSSLGSTLPLLQQEGQVGVKELGADLSWLWNRRTEKGNEGSCFQGRHVQVLASLTSGPSVTVILLLRVFLGIQAPA